MKWLVFSYSLPTKGGSSSRVTVWRRLQNLGALEVTGIYILPENPATTEAFIWLSQEVRAAKGEATIMQVEKFHGLTDKAMMEKFNTERAKDYQHLLEEISLYQKTSEGNKGLNKLRRQLDDIVRIDFFTSPMKAQATKMLAKLEQSIKNPLPITPIKTVKKEDFQNKTWVTRPKPYVDRLSSIWLIRRFIDAKATILYREKAQLKDISFDMEAAMFGHSSHLCTFETIIAAFKLKDSILPKMADIIHELDLQEGSYVYPQSYGIEAVLKGWLTQGLVDSELEVRGIQLFEGLYQSLKEKQNA